MYLKYLVKIEYFIKKKNKHMPCIIGIDTSKNSTGISIKFDNNTYIYYIISSKMTHIMESFSHKNVNILKYEKRDVKNLEYSNKEIEKTHNFMRLIDKIQWIIDK